MLPIYNQNILLLRKHGLLCHVTGTSSTLKKVKQFEFNSITICCKNVMKNACGPIGLGYHSHEQNKTTRNRFDYKHSKVKFIPN